MMAATSGTMTRHTAGLENAMHITPQRQRFIPVQVLDEMQGEHRGHGCGVEAQAPSDVATHDATWPMPDAPAGEATGQPGENRSARESSLP